MTFAVSNLKKFLKSPADSLNTLLVSTGVVGRMRGCAAAACSLSGVANVAVVSPGFSVGGASCAHAGTANAHITRKHAAIRKTRIRLPLSVEQNGNQYLTADARTPPEPTSPNSC